MKNKAMLKITLIIASMFFYSCPVMDPEHEEESDHIRGNGLIANEMRKTGEFSAVEIVGKFSLMVDSGNVDSIMISTDENILPHIVTEVNSTCLKVYPDVSISPSTTPALLLKKTAISSITSEGDADVTFKKVNTNVFECTSDGSCSAVLSGNTSVLSIAITGSGAINAFDLNADSVFIDITGSADVEVTAKTFLSVSIKGVGKVFYKGAPITKQTIDGIGSIEKKL